MPLTQAESVRNFFSTDTQTRNALGGVLHTSDIVVGLRITQRHQHGEMLLDKQRTRLGKIMRNARGEMVAHMSISVLLFAKPNAYERANICRIGLADMPISGVFIRNIVVKAIERGQGYGAILLDEVRRFAQLLRLPIFCDVTAHNVRMRKFIRREGGVESIFWHTPKGTLMVRYMWR